MMIARTVAVIWDKAAVSGECPFDVGGTKNYNFRTAPKLCAIHHKWSWRHCRVYP